MKITDKLFGIVLTLCGISVFIYSRSIPPLQGQDVGAGLFLLIISTIFFVCGLILACRGHQQQHQHQASVQADAQSNGTVRSQSQHLTPLRSIQTPVEFRNKRVLLGFVLVPLCLLFYVNFSAVLGFLPAAFLILMALFLVFKVRPWLAVLVAIAATLLVHSVFYSIMSVPLPWGILETVAW